MSAQEVLLSRQNEELLKLAAAAENGALLDFKGVLVVVNETLVQDLLHAVTPVAADVGNGFHVTIDSAAAAFGEASLSFAWGARPAWAAPPWGHQSRFSERSTSSSDPVSGILRCRVSILGVEAQDATALGGNDPVGRLTEALTRGGLALLLGSFEIPVSIENRVSIPAVESKHLQIAAEDLPLAIAVQQVKVFGGRLWVFVDAPSRPVRESPRRRVEVGVAARFRGDGVGARGLRQESSARRSDPPGVAPGNPRPSPRAAREGGGRRPAGGFAGCRRPGTRRTGHPLGPRRGTQKGRWPGATWIASP